MRDRYRALLLASFEDATAIVTECNDWLEAEFDDPTAVPPATVPQIALYRSRVVDAMSDVDGFELPTSTTRCTVMGPVRRPQPSARIKAPRRGYPSMSALAWTLAALLAVPAVYCGLSAAVLLFVRVPDEPHFTVIEDLLFVVTVPFVVAVLGITLLRRER